MTELLIVEDEQSIRDIFCERLTDEGFKVHQAANGIDGLKQARQHRPDLIISDVSMPEMDGIDFFKNLQSDTAEMAAIPFIFLTGKSDEGDEIANLNLGADGHLNKPVKFDLLTALIKSRLGYRERQLSLLREKLKSSFDPLFKNKKSAVGEYQSLEKLIDHYKEITSTITHSDVNYSQLTHATFSLKTLKDAKQVSSNLANMCPEPDLVIVGIIEMIINGIEHGNLNIGYQLKTELLKKGTWTNEIERRLALPENATKSVTVTYEKTPDKIKFEFIDDGGGFDFDTFLDFDPMRSQDLHGRGIALAKAVVFDDLTYLDNGHRVIACINNAK